MVEVTGCEGSGFSNTSSQAASLLTMRWPGIVQLGRVTVAKCQHSWPAEPCCGGRAETCPVEFALLKPVSVGSSERTDHPTELDPSSLEERPANDIALTFGRYDRTGLVLAAAITLLLFIDQASAQSERAVLDQFFPVGKDFCLGRVYDPAHLNKNPRQSVTAIFLGGRNAQRSSANPGKAGDNEPTTAGNVFVTLTVRFRGKPSPRIWPGACFEAGTDAIRCKIYPPRNQDTLVQELTLRRKGSGVAMEASGDWQVFRRAADSDLEMPEAAHAEKLFSLAPLHLSACLLSKDYWAADGATAKLLRALP
jgi:hypothetical protein